MANDYRLRLIADIRELIGPLQQIPGVTQAAAQRAAMALAQNLQRTGGSANVAARQIAEFNQNLIRAGISQQAAARETLKYAASLNAANAAAKNAAGSSGNVSAGVAGMGQQLADVAVQLQMGTNPFTILVQQGPQIASVIALTQGGIKAIGAQMLAWGTMAAGPVALVTAAVGTGYLAWKTYYEELERGRRIGEELNQLAMAQASLIEDTATTVRQLKVERGELTKEEAKGQEAALSAFKKYNTATEEARKRLAALRKEQDSLTTSYADFGERLSMGGWNPFAKAMDGILTSTSELKAEQDALSEGLADATDNLNINKEEHIALIAEQKKNEEAAKRQKKAVKEHKDALKELNEEIARQIALSQKNSATYYENEKALEAIKDAAEQADDVERQRLTTAYETQLQQAKAARDAMLVAQDSASARENTERAYTEAVEALHANLYRQLRAMEDDFTARKQAQEEKRFQAVQANIQAQLDLLQKGDADRKAMLVADLQAVQGVADSYLGAATTLIDRVADSTQTALEGTRDALKEVQESLGQTQDWLKELSEETLNAATLSGAGLVEAYKAGQVAAEDLTEAQKAQLTQALTAESLILEAKETSLAKAEAAQQQAALKAWQAQQAASAAQAVVLAAQSILQALASAPPPYNIALAAGAGIAAATQVAAIATAPPPSFRAGGEVPWNAPRLPGGFSDQRLVSAEPGEKIYNQQESRIIDGMMARMSQPVVVQNTRRNRVISEEIVSALPQSAKLRAALTATNKPTRRNYYA